MPHYQTFDSARHNLVDDEEYLEVDGNGEVIGANPYIGGEEKDTAGGDHDTFEFNCPNNELSVESGDTIETVKQNLAINDHGLNQQLADYDTFAVKIAHQNYYDRPIAGFQQDDLTMGYDGLIDVYYGADIV